MIACFCTRATNSIVCIEEPEIHLHPLLQRKLINYLLQETSNQYFIATHSASMIDHADATIFHVTQESGQTRFSQAITTDARVGIWRDLGYKPSDLLQTNFIIWVEGPSDRLYILHWIKSIQKNLQEGLHFSIMFYGGKLLSHVTGGDELASDLINLRRLNQHMAIVIDSDKYSKSAQLNKTKERVISEFREAGNIAWVTDGREIENYIDPNKIEFILKNKILNFEKISGKSKYSDLLSYRKNDGDSNTKKYQAEKISLAREVCMENANLDIYDLREKISELTNAILDANQFN